MIQNRSQRSCGAIKRNPSMRCIRCWRATESMRSTCSCSYAVRSAGVRRCQGGRRPPLKRTTMLDSGVWFGVMILNSETQDTRYVEGDVTHRLKSGLAASQTLVPDPCLECQLSFSNDPACSSCLVWASDLSRSLLQQAGAKRNRPVLQDRVSGKVEVEPASAGFSCRASAWVRSDGPVHV